MSPDSLNPGYLKAVNSKVILPPSVNSDLRIKDAADTDNEYAHAYAGSRKFFMAIINVNITHC
jgi:hypothetical protein